MTHGRESRPEQTHRARRRWLVRVAGAAVTLAVAQWTHAAGGRARRGVSRRPGGGCLGTAAARGTAGRRRGARPCAQEHQDHATAQVSAAATGRRRTRRRGGVDGRAADADRLPGGLREELRRPCRGRSRSGGAALAVDGRRRPGGHVRTGVAGRRGVARATRVRGCARRHGSARLRPECAGDDHGGGAADRDVARRTSGGQIGGGVDADGVRRRACGRVLSPQGGEEGRPAVLRSESIASGRSPHAFRRHRGGALQQTCRCGVPHRHGLLGGAACRGEVRVHERKRSVGRMHRNAAERPRPRDAGAVFS